MLKGKCNPEFISKVTNLSISEINKLKVNQSVKIIFEKVLSFFYMSKMIVISKKILKMLIFLEITLSNRKKKYRVLKSMLNYNFIVVMFNNNKK